VTSLLVPLAAYNALQIGLSPLLVARFVRRVFWRHKDHTGWAQRLGLRPLLEPDAAAAFHAAAPRVWVFCRSLGEYRAALPLLRRLLAEQPRAALLIYATTAEVVPAIRETLPGERVFGAYLPYDCLGPAWAHWRAAPPDLVLFVESFWYPNLLPLARVLGARTAVLNFTVKPITFRHTRHFTFCTWLRHAVDLFCVQVPNDVTVLQRMGCDPARLVIAGNAKFDVPPAEFGPEQRGSLCGALGIGSALLIAGSTHEGEEEVVLSAYRQVWERMASAGSSPAQLILAPRYVRRAAELEALARRHGFRTAVRSGSGHEARSRVPASRRDAAPGARQPPRGRGERGGGEGRRAGEVGCHEARSEETGHAGEPLGHLPASCTVHRAPCCERSEPWDVMILDTIGELSRLYYASTAAFVGGSLAPVGGHNLVEPIAAGVPTLFGPHVSAFRAVAEDAVAAGVAEYVVDADSLAAAWQRALTDEEYRGAVAARARTLLLQCQGATDRWLTHLATLLREEGCNGI
jgi:3-deoxy-D-manno-octulosonic-acid transferase